MRIVTRKIINKWSEEHPDAATALESWSESAEAINWANILEVRQTYRSADAVIVGSGRTATVFNIRGNNYRMIAAIHYNTGIIYMLRFLTHAEYDTDKWKREL